MLISKNILAIIPARGGSKSIPRKNIVQVGGKPLIAWTIKTSLHSKYVFKTVVTSEDDEILAVSRKYGADVVIRPKRYAQDNTLMVPVVKDCLSQLSKRKEIFDIFVLLQPTSPLRNSDDLDRAFKLFFEKKATALISGYGPDKSPYKSFRITHEGWLHGLVNNKLPFTNRQHLPPTFYSNGAIYIIYVKEFLKTNNFFTQKTLPFIMSFEKSIDIDSMEDVRKISSIMDDINGSKNK